MKNSNMTKKLIDRIAFVGLFALCAILVYMFIDKLIYKQPTLHSLAVVFISVIITVIIVTVAIIVVVKKYGPYRTKDETPLPAIYYLGMLMLWQYPTRIVFNKAYMISETATDTSVGVFQIVALMSVFLVLTILYAKVMRILEVKYNHKKSDKKEHE